jgi:hypothetical protein
VQSNDSEGGDTTRGRGKERLLVGTAHMDVLGQFPQLELQTLRSEIGPLRPRLP